MAIRLEVAQDFINQNFPIKLVLKHCKIARSTFYYKPTGGFPGRQSYAVFRNENHEIISGEDVIVKLKELFGKPFVDYGYYKAYIHLRDNLGYSVSKHSIYKLMRICNLIRNRYIESSKKGKRNWVTDLIPKSIMPFDYFEFDIKFVWIAGQNRNMQVLTVIDINSRWNVGQFLSFSITKKDVINLFDKIFQTYNLPKGLCVRSDNGSQFIALVVQDYFRNKEVLQEFTKPATPVQDAHIESYHSIMESAVCQRFEFVNINEAKKTFVEWREFYNFERIHGGIGFKSPFKYLLQLGIDMKSTTI